MDITEPLRSKNSLKECHAHHFHTITRRVVTTGVGASIFPQLQQATSCWGSFYNWSQPHEPPVYFRTRHAGESPTWIWGGEGEEVGSGRVREEDSSFFEQTNRWKRGPGITEDFMVHVSAGVVLLHHYRILPANSVGSQRERWRHGTLSPGWCWHETEVLLGFIMICLQQPHRLPS